MSAIGPHPHAETGEDCPSREGEPGEGSTFSRPLICVECGQRCPEPK